LCPPEGVARGPTLPSTGHPAPPQGGDVTCTGRAAASAAALGAVVLTSLPRYKKSPARCQGTGGARDNPPQQLLLRYETVQGVYCRVPGFIRWPLGTAVQTRSLRIRRDFECAGAPVADGVDAGGPHQRAWSPTHARLWPLHPRQDPFLQAQAFEAIAVSQMEKTARHIHPSAI
jgi:hypothetical protein